MKLPPLVIQPDDAESVKDGWRILRQRDFSGGENLDENTCAANQLLIGENCEINRDGYLAKAAGSSQVITSTTDVLGVWAVKYVDTFRLFWLSSTSLTVATWSGLGAIDASMFSVVKNQPFGLLSAVHWGEKMVFFPYSGTPFYCDLGTPTVTTDIPSAPNLVDAVIYAGKIWGIEAITHNLRFSQENSFTGWDALDTVSVSQEDGMKLSQIAKAPGGLVLFKHRNAYSLVGSSRFDLSISRSPIFDRGVDATANTVSQNAVDGFFLAYDGIYSYDISKAKMAIDPNAQKEYLSTLAFTTFRGVKLRNSNKVLFAAVGNAKSMVMDLDTGAVFKRTGMSLNTSRAYSMSDMSEGTNYSYAYLFVRQEQGLFGVYDGIQDQTITFKIQTRHENFGTFRDKVFRRLIVDIESAVNSVTVKAFIDHGAAITVANSVNLPAGENSFYLYDTNNNRLTGQTISIEISTVNTPVIRSIGMEFRETGSELG